MRADPMIDVLVILMISYFAWYSAPGAVPDPPLAVQEIPLPDLIYPEPVAPEPAPAVEPVEVEPEAESVAVPEVEPAPEAVIDAPLPEAKRSLSAGD